MRLVDKAKTAVREPHKVPPYVRQQAHEAVLAPPRRAMTRAKTRGLSDQRAMLDSLRDNDEYLLIVLDACRFDALASVFDRWFEGDIEPVRAAGRDTFEYVQTCWPAQHDVTYYSGAVPVNSQALEFDEEFQTLYDGYVPRDHIENIVDVWAEEWDESLGVCPPWAVTDRALDGLDEDQLVVHYFQPHAPYVGEKRELGHTDNESARPGDGDPVDKPIWERVKSGEITQERLRAVYESNLEAALREVAKLVEAAPHDNVAVMGDHGEALGEFGVFAHPRKEHPAIRRVPFAHVEGLTDYARRQTEKNPESYGSDDNASVQDRLSSLGYIE